MCKSLIINNFKRKYQQNSRGKLKNFNFKEKNVLLWRVL